MRLPKVKNIQYSYHLSNFLGSLLKSQKNLLVKHKYFFTKYILRNTETLVRVGLLAGFKIVLKKKSITSILQKRGALIIYLKYFEEAPLIQSVHIYSTPGKRVYITYYVVKNLVKLYPGSFIFLSTSIGVISHLEAFKKKIGGLLLYKIN